MKYVILFAYVLMAMTPLFVFGKSDPGDSFLNEKLTSIFLKDLPKNSKLSLGKMSLSRPITIDDELMTYTPNPPLGLVQLQFESRRVGVSSALGYLQVKAFAPILVAKQDLPAGALLTSENTMLESKELSLLQKRGYFEVLPPKETLFASVFISRGSAINFSNAKRPFAISFGQTVELLYRKGPIEISARVKSLENGYPGDWIRVENISSKKQLKVRVDSIGNVTL